MPPHIDDDFSSKYSSLTRAEKKFVFLYAYCLNELKRAS